MNGSDPSLLHDPGGKVRIRLASGIVGSADYSPCGRYRSVLTRALGSGSGTILWIGANPSTAGAEVDDRTVRRETDFSRAMGYAVIAKVNVMDFRATYPRDLRVPGVVARSAGNLAVVLALAAGSDGVVACWGALHRRFEAYGRETMAALLEAGIAPLHYGLTKDGHPRHPLYLARTSVATPYARAA